MRVLIGSRISDLARLQAFEVGNTLKAAAGDIEVRYHFRESLGDKNLNDPLWKMPERGVFTEDFHESLLSGEVDLVVHSWKDLPVEKPQGTHIVATLNRADVRDILLFKKDSRHRDFSDKNMIIYSSSPRRAYNGDEFLKTALPFKFSSLKFESVRGNIPTRLKKYLHDHVDGIVLAKAALDRLLSSQEPEFEVSRNIVREALAASLFMIFPLSASPTAAAQGALAIEVVQGRSPRLDEILNRVNVAKDFECVKKERECLSQYGGGCHQKIGVTVLKRAYGELKFLRGKTDLGEELREKELSNVIFFPRVSGERLWASEEKKSFVGELFERRLFQVAKPEKNGVYFVSRSQAWPLLWKASDEDIVWTGGLDTWKKLAHQGIWVNGSSESLGEQEDPRLNLLIGSKMNWIKLTHTEGFESSGVFMRSLATYELVSHRFEVNKAAVMEKLKEKTHFYWSSGSQFKAIAKIHPFILEGFHGCGPGNTYQILKKYLGEKSSGRLAVFLNEADWRKKVGVQ